MMLRNALWSLLGEGVPLAAAFVAIPLLMKSIGVERFGALTLIWAVLGYLAVLDLGLVRSLVQIIAEGRSDPASPKVVGIPATALALISALGLIGGGAVAVFADPLAAMLTDGGGLQDEMRRALYVVAFIVPVALVSAALRGVLEAHARFRALNIARMAMGVLNYASPLAVLPFYGDLPAVMLAIAAGRVIGLAAFIRLCAPLIPPGWRFRRPENLRPLLRMSGWMMLGNLIGPAMMYADRFVLGVSVATATIAYYTTPFEVVTRLLFAPTALAGVIFPLAAQRGRKNPQDLGPILAFGAGATIIAFSAAFCFLFFFGEQLLGWWLGADFARNSVAVSQILCLGVMLNAIAYTPNAVIQGIGRADATARLQLAELPLYIAVLWILAHRFGLEGAAAAWALRTGADLFALLLISARVAPHTRNAAATAALLTVAAAGAAVIGLTAGNTAGSWAVAVGFPVIAVGAAVMMLRARRRI
jgi:O-antigen/teichoic acid export membrane protein